MGLKYEDGEIKNVRRIFFKNVCRIFFKKKKKIEKLDNNLKTCGFTKWHFFHIFKRTLLSCLKVELPIKSLKKS